MGNCVNPLHVGELISTQGRKDRRAIRQMCQSPSRRGTHFYEAYDEVLDAFMKSVNPLHVGELVSTFFYYPELRFHSCVNPLHVGELISTFFLLSRTQIPFLCQSPSRRGTHFYKMHLKRITKELLVSIPFTSGNSFLREEAYPEMAQQICVNPLHVGELIYRLSES